MHSPICLTSASRFIWSVPIILSIGIMILTGFTSKGNACAGVPPENHTLRIDSEQALIIWDGETQRFIRRGVFKSAHLTLAFLSPRQLSPH